MLQLVKSLLFLHEMFYESILNLKNQIWFPLNGLKTFQDIIIIFFV